LRYFGIDHPLRQGPGLADRTPPASFPEGTPMSSAHPGFAAVAAKIAARQGIPAKRAAAILASKTRKAGPAAKRRNPRLKRVR
jgi:hypothetical protein